ncbi:hypothetical protein NC652_031031 [Populus alba x Populus x berolinensis]|nr:hypothetical protein NC652_032119 [Populus alba x Populus x berolinensis]KAJ6883940.1 hypothetical protein NC652_031031 [Populus alba x Populus x berolinensis]
MKCVLEWGDAFNLKADGIASSTNHYGQTWHTEAKTRTLTLKPKAVLLNPARPGGSTRDPGPGPGRATQKIGGRKKTARPGLTRIDPGRVYLVGVAEVWLRLVGVIEIWLMGGVIEARLWWERGRNL